MAMNCTVGFTASIGAQMIVLFVEVGGRSGKMRIKINLQKITENAMAITDLCAAHGITVMGVTKSCCGMPEVARAMLAGGVEGLADSRLSNIRRMREAGIKVDMLLLRSPALSETAETVKLVGNSLNSEFEVVASLAQEARALGKLHRVILMVDVGDRREGVMPQNVAELAKRVESLEGIRLLGLGSNIGCLSEIRPSSSDTQLLVQLAAQVEEAIGRELDVISGGSSIHLRMVAQGRLPARINQLRIGHKILLGFDPPDGHLFSLTSQDAFTFIGEVIEVGWKPTLPISKSGHSDVGDYPGEEEDVRCRAVLAVGTQDVRTEWLNPRAPGVTIVGATSDHLVLDVTGNRVKVGDKLEFGLGYRALMTAMASPYVRKEILSLRQLDFVVT
jgi:predicted amino acid racemase